MRTAFALLRARLAIIHLVYEARGTDVNPGTIDKFRRAGVTESVTGLEQIHCWFTWFAYARTWILLRLSARRCGRGGGVTSMSSPTRRIARRPRGAMPELVICMARAQAVKPLSRAVQRPGRAGPNERPLLAPRPGLKIFQAGPGHLSRGFCSTAGSLAYVPY